MTRIPSLPIAILLLPLTSVADSPTSSTPDFAALELPPEISLWPGSAPGAIKENFPWEPYAQEWRQDADGGRMVIWVTEPSLQVFRPQNPNGTGLVICPGGGYNIVVIEREGWQVARRLNEFGITCFVLKYRHYDRDAALQDAHRALRLVRSRAGEWGVDPQRLGVGGFSAGAHLACRAGLVLDQPETWEKDATDALSKRPDFLLLVYGEMNTYFNEPVPTLGPETPPAFLVGSQPDHPEFRLQFYQRLIGAGAAAELHLFATGEHGFGANPTTQPGKQWPGLFARWLEVLD